MSFEKGCFQACKQDPHCPYMINRVPPTPYPPPPPLPVVPIPDWTKDKVGLRFLPRVPMPKGEVNADQDLDYDGNPVPRNPAASLLSVGVVGVPSRLVSFGDLEQD